MNKNDLMVILHECLLELIDNDSYLLEQDVHEQTISSTLAYYLKQKIIPRNLGGWDVDPEFNRNIDEPKCILAKGNVKPDIIIHRRGLNNEKRNEDNNLLVIEIKKDSTQIEESDDCNKIKALIEEYPFNYCYGVFININRRTKTFSQIWQQRKNI